MNTYFVRKTKRKPTTKLIIEINDGEVTKVVNPPTKMTTVQRVAHSVINITGYIMFGATEPSY
jgi:hypothetical protein